MNTNFMLEFLRVADDKQFTKRKTELNQLKKPTKTSEIPSLKGCVINFLKISLGYQQD